MLASPFLNFRLISSSSDQPKNRKMDVLLDQDTKRLFVPKTVDK